MGSLQWELGNVLPSPTHRRNREETDGPLWCLPLTARSRWEAQDQEDQEPEVSLGSKETQASLKTKRKG